MRLDIEKHIPQCLSCAETKGATQTAPILEYPLPAGPFDVVVIDLLQQPRSIQGSIYVLLCVDHFSRFTVLALLPNKSATIMSHAIVYHLICHYLHDSSFLFSDQNLRILRDICTQFYIQQTFYYITSPCFKRPRWTYQQENPCKSTLMANNANRFCVHDSSVCQIFRLEAHNTRNHTKLNFVEL